MEMINYTANLVESQEDLRKSAVRNHPKLETATLWIEDGRSVVLGTVTFDDGSSTPYMYVVDWEMCIDHREMPFWIEGSNLDDCIRNYMLQYGANRYVH